MTTLSTVKAQAPGLVGSYMQVGKLLTSKGMRQGTHKAAVLLAFDHSGSTESGENRLYSSGEMARVAHLGFSAGLFFDDDGEIPTALFDTNTHKLGNMNLGNYEHFLDQHKQYGYGGTSYLTVMRWAIQMAGFSDVNLGRSIKGLEVKATATDPIYVGIVTDGEPQNDDIDEIINLLILASQLPIYWQFMGVGKHSFTFLKRLDKLEGRLIDNAGFFDSKEAETTERFLELMLGEFASSYYPGAKELGLIA